MNTRDGSSSKYDDDKNCALDGKENKWKEKSSHSTIPNQILVRKERRRTCQGLNVFTVMNWDTMPQSFCTRRSERSLQEHRQVDFTLISCMVTSMMGSVWYLDSGASFHMTDNK